MAVKKISISMDSEVAARAQHAARRAGMSLSAWLSLAADRAAHVAEARAVLQEHFEEYGAPDPEEVSAVRAELGAIGFGRPMSEEQQRARRRALAWLDGVREDEAGDES